ncbi:MAG TPA: hypothetical protein VGH28_27505 [Polyangiaceae bacterium]|jgi:tetratricopeptide (TPR) repeat protein
MGTDDAETRARERWNEPTQTDDQKCVRVRACADPTLESYTASGWAPFEMSPPRKISEHLIWRLKHMAEIPVDAALAWNGRIRLILGPAPRRTEKDFDVHFSRGKDGLTLVMALVPVPEDKPHDAERWRRASVLLNHAEDAPTRDAVLSLVREATTLVPDGDDARGSVLRRAAWVCVQSGLHAEALALFGLALSDASNVRVRADLEHCIGAIHEENRRLVDAKAWYARALATAQEAPLPLLDSIAPLFDFADVAMKENDLAAAEEWLARAEALVADVLGPTSAAFVVTRARRAELLQLRGEVSEAERVAAEALEDASRYRLDDEAHELRRRLAELALVRGDAACAVAHVRTILGAPSRHPMRARDYSVLARAHRELGKDDEALAALRSASALVEGAFASDHPLCVEIERERAQLTARSPYRS